MTRQDATWANILIVDDQEPNVILLERMLEQWRYANVTATTQSHEVPSLCAKTPPDLLLLDLQMPKPDGFELMEILAPMIEQSPRLPVLVLTADITTATRQRALAAGARDFLSKPLDPIEVRLRIANLLETRGLEREMLGQNQLLEGAVRERTGDLERARVELLERLALAAEYRDDNTQEHAQRVGRTVARLAAAMDLPAGDVEVLLRASPLHDIGKIGVPDAILLKSAPLTLEEFGVMRAHTTIGAEILSGSEFAILRTAERIASSHHERWDGGGYPNGLAGNEIPLAGRLAALADVFDALVHERPYKTAWPLEQALEEIVSLRGTHFDPDVIDAFLTLDHAALLDPIWQPPEVPAAAVAALRR
jgi:response regulator RpfG family c-di-GMP phosphodiesterase